MRVFSLFFTVQPRGLTFLLHRHQTGSQVVFVQCFVLSTTQRPYFFVNFWLSPDDPTYFCIFLSLNAKNHALTQWPLIFWACALTECPSLLEGGPYTRIHFIFDCPPPPLICLLLYYLRYQPHLIHNITRWATKFVNPVLVFWQVGNFWSFPVHYQYPVCYCSF